MKTVLKKLSVFSLGALFTAATLSGCGGPSEPKRDASFTPVNSAAADDLASPSDTDGNTNNIVKGEGYSHALLDGFRIFPNPPKPLKTALISNAVKDLRVGVAFEAEDSELKAITPGLEKYLYQLWASPTKKETTFQGVPAVVYSGFREKLGKKFYCMQTHWVHDGRFYTVLAFGPQVWKAKVEKAMKEVLASFKYE